MNDDALPTKPLTAPAPAYEPPPDDGLRLWHVDADLLVVDKPAGLLAEPGRGPEKADCLLARVQREFADALLVHRLDMATSGLMLFARGRLMQQRLHAAFREREVGKRYVAVVQGRPSPAEGEIDLPIAADWPRRPLRKIDVTGQAALTRYRVLAQDFTDGVTHGVVNDVTHDVATNASRLELEPVTGRTHQLRLHLAAIGHPILGDTLYGGEARARAPRLLLHADRLALRHPDTGAMLVVESVAAF